MQRTRISILLLESVILLFLVMEKKVFSSLTQKCITRMCSENRKNYGIRGLLAQRLALVYLYGKNIDKSLPLAEAYAKAAVDSGADKAYTIFAKACFAQDKHSDGMAALREGMAKGDPGATYAYGLQLIAGKHCTKNRDEGLVTIMCAAELSCIPAANYIMTLPQKQQLVRFRLLRKEQLVGRLSEKLMHI